MNQSPFLGVYETEDGAFVDMLSGSLVDEENIKSKKSPFYGVFLDKDGIRHELKDLSVPWTQLKYNDIIVNSSSPVQSFPVNDWLSITLTSLNNLVRSAFVSTSPDTYTFQLARTSSWGGTSTENQNRRFTISSAADVEIDNDEGYDGFTINVLYLRIIELQLCYDIRIFTNVVNDVSNCAIRVISRD